MGRRIKNLEIKSRAYSVRLPVGSSTSPIVQAQNPIDGQMYFNTSTGNAEIFYNGSWHGVGLVGRALIVKDAFVGDGLQVTWVMANSYLSGHEAEILIFIDGVFQNPGIAYTVSGYNITFTSAPNPGVSIVALHNFNSTKVQ